MSKINNERPLMQQNIPGDTCPECGAKEVEHNSPRTMYSCGSSDYDGRPGTFFQTEKCKNKSKE